MVEFVEQSWKNGSGAVPNTPYGLFGSIFSGFSSEALSYTGSNTISKAKPQWGEATFTRTRMTKPSN